MIYLKYFNVEDVDGFGRCNYRGQRAEPVKLLTVFVCIRASEKAPSHLGDYCHKMCRCSLIVQSLARFNSEDPAVSINGELGKRGILIIESNS